MFIRKFITILGHLLKFQKQFLNLVLWMFPEATFESDRSSGFTFTLHRLIDCLPHVFKGVPVAQWLTYWTSISEQAR